MHTSLDAKAEKPTELEEENVGKALPEAQVPGADEVTKNDELEEDDKPSLRTENPEERTGGGQGGGDKESSPLTEGHPSTAEGKEIDNTMLVDGDSRVAMNGDHVPGGKSTGLSEDDRNRSNVGENSEVAENVRDVSNMGDIQETRL